MNETEFLKEHPSLKGKTIISGTVHDTINKTKPEYVGFLVEDIHETQLDKQKVKDAIDKCVGLGKMSSPEMVFALRLKKELGLE